MDPKPLDFLIHAKWSVLPWRFNRSYSYVRRPFLLRRSGTRTDVLWGFRHVYDAWTNLLSLTLLSIRLAVRMGLVTCLSGPTLLLLCVQLEFRSQSSHELPLARQLVLQKASGNGSLPGASLRYWPAPEFDEPRSRGPNGSFP
jgi:hypothetical protein